MSFAPRKEKGTAICPKVTNEYLAEMKELDRIANEKANPVQVPFPTGTTSLNPPRSGTLTLTLGMYDQFRIVNREDWTMMLIKKKPFIWAMFRIDEIEWNEFMLHCVD
ncbi:hypothetical protein MTR_2g059680 [Medicago truncatula]|uniref:Uncharacterized protein n=1 Tax=Medicago truncatula TaxID=3880 RepID=G7IGP5_MEDTR|nr:hypothetical protein MTR_2g059680 [Medicago truncatula]